jgi:hypothetical protein
MPDADRYEPLPGLLQMPGHLVRRLSRRGRLLAAAAALLVVAAAAVVLPGALESKREHAAAEERAAIRARAARLQTLRAEMRPVAGRGTPGPGLVADLAAAVREDSVARARSGELAERPYRVECRRFPPGRRSYACLAVTAEIPEQETTHGGSIGYPYRALVDPRSGRFTFCKISGRPGEGSLARTVTAPVPPACGGR